MTVRRSVVVVGSGLAGIVAALEASRSHDVHLLTKAPLEESNSRYAQGGIAAVLGGAEAVPGDSIALHVRDTLVAGAGLSEVSAVEVLCSDGPERVRDLIGWGVRFDRDGDRLARGLEAAHSASRIVHGGGDATGRAVQDALLLELASSSVEVHEGAFVRDVVVEDGVVAGVDLLDPDGVTSTLRADRVVLATGGAGQLYPYTTNPAVATADGVALALRAGAVVEDLEFYQFHPTLLAVPGGALVSEAVRGEGAVLRGVDGERFMLAVHPDAELAPRDVVARGIASRMATQEGRPVLLDATSLGADFLVRRFPGLDAQCRRLGLDWTREPIPVTLAAHYWMGGVRTDDRGRTSVPGLYAIGEVACTGVHGANRLASNSLLEAAVFARRCADALSDPAEGVQVGEPYVLDDGAGDLAPPSREELQTLMWDVAGVHREGSTLERALGLSRTWACGERDTVSSCEDANLREVAQVMLAAALVREESRGAHHRADHPRTRDEFARHLSWARKVTS